ncbi:hypothetical protein [Photobacterium phosphoreum]|uniref:hypothetical protein n=1 Tax=Photobacterium phosphoreum TaxID=659 RepID=UPI001E2AF9C1|nr:hypothetical protein [Photobacterium phosphoreum]MCD9502133.1 hypothetical protein [Photobacterium phosphoreum]
MTEIRKQFLGNLPRTDDSDMLACVGANGNPDSRDYAFGFLNAAELLLEQQHIKKPHRAKYPADHMVYPICFNIRHGIEISIKYFLDELEKLYAQRKLTFEVTSKNAHNIEVIWKDYSQLAIQFDVRLGVMAQQLTKYIQPWAEIDATGQTFRYASSNNAQKHLTEYSIIDLFKVRLNLESLKTHLEDNFSLLSELGVEFDCNTYTKNLSRWDLYKLAKELPLYIGWGERLKDVKARWVNERGLSSNDFNRACDLIKSHWEFAIDIGLEVPLTGGVTAEDIVWSIEKSMHYHNALNVPVTENSDDLINSFVEYKKRKMIWLSGQEYHSILERLSPELVATVSSLYYNNKRSSYCEDYRWYYEYEVKNLSINDSNSLRQEFMRILEKKTFISGVVDGLSLLGQHSIIEKLILIEDIHAHFDEATILECKSKTERCNDWFVSLPSITKVDKFLSDLNLE